MSDMIDKIIKKRKGTSTKMEDYIFPILENGLTPLEMDKRIPPAFIWNINHAHLVYISEALWHSNRKKYPKLLWQV